MSVRRLTPAGVGGVSVVEVSGSTSLGRLEEVLGRALPGEGRAALVRLMRTPADQGGPGGQDPRGEDLLDEGLLLHRGPECVELCLHGNPLLVQEVIQRLEPESEPDARERDLSVEAAAWQRLPHIESECGARLVLDQAQGALRREALAWARGEVSGPTSWVDRHRSSAALVRPPLVVLTGASNTGKSTLFNLLLGEERAMVSGELGTTRDTLAAPLALDDWVVRLVDTAGVRDLGSTAKGAVEAEGMRLGRELSARAELTLELVDYQGLSPDTWPDPAPEPGRRVLVSRADAMSEELAASNGKLAISALRDPEHARALVGDLILEGLGCTGREARWQADRGVPLELERAEALDGARPLPPGEARESRVLGVLNGDTSGQVSPSTRVAHGNPHP
ncbi:MAG TPA: hypothetical protein EYQ74_04140 [Planctomycetes bacterium]|nr:hypothetical protein [Planctomycetota bacterium]HIK59254.1 hypothetical protein [Planctomycetota bacterium]